MLLAWPPPGLGLWDLLPQCLPLPMSHLPQRAETPDSPEKGPRLHLHPQQAGQLPERQLPACRLSECQKGWFWELTRFLSGS